MKVLVTGGAGFIGSHSVAVLKEEGHHVAVVDNMLKGKEENLQPEVQYYPVNILGEELDRIFRREEPEAVLHLAAQVDVASSRIDPRYDAMNNIMGTIAVLEKCRAYQIRKIIFSSSAAVYGTPLSLPLDEEQKPEPLSFYGLSKLTAERYIEKYCQEAGMEYTILRYSNVYGPSQKLKGESGVISIFYNLMRKGLIPVIYGDGRQTRDFIYVKDVAQANMASMRSIDNGIINIGTGTSISVLELYNMISKMMGNNSPALFSEQRPGDIKDSCLNIHKAKSVLSWKPLYQISSGLSELIEG